LDCFYLFSQFRKKGENLPLMTISGMKRISVYSIVILSSLFLAGCYYDVASELYPDENCNTPAVVDYATQVKALIDSRCATSGCHVAGGSGPGDFSVCRHRYRSRSGWFNRSSFCGAKRHAAKSTS
jgi:hypothetical protein